MKRDLSFEVTNYDELNKMLTGLLMDVRRGIVDHETAKSITLVAHKINKNNANAIEYKKVSKHRRDIDFFKNSKSTA